MAYQVALADTAKADANRIYDWVVERAPLRGPEWFDVTVHNLPRLHSGDIFPCVSQIEY